MRSRHTRQAVAILIAAVVTVSVVGCAPAPIQLTERDDGTSQTLNKSQEIRITLESNPSTGYSWQVFQAPDPVLEQIGGAVYQAPTGTAPAVGAPGTETFTFKAVQSGTATLGLGYSRPWESVAPTRTFTVTVTVR